MLDFENKEVNDMGKGGNRDSRTKRVGSNPAYKMPKVHNNPPKTQKPPKTKK